jgi:hypothetical protein
MPSPRLETTVGKIGAEARFDAFFFAQPPLRALITFGERGYL